MKNIKLWGELNERNETGFKTTIDDVSVYELKDGEDKVDTYGNKAEVEWKIEPEMKNDCIKAMNFTVTRVVCNIAWTKGEDDDIEGETVFDSSAKEYADWEVKEEVEFGPNGSLFLGSVEIDFKTKTVTVQ